MDLTRLKTAAVDAQWVAVSVERNQSCGLHAGVLYKQSNEVFAKLHFCWHRVLRSGPPNRGDVFAVPDTQFDDDKMWLAVFCARVARNIPGKNIPYNLEHDESVRFDRDSGELQLNGATGLSCATFIVAVFRSAGHPLVDASDWPKASDDDMGVQRSFVEALEGDPRSSAQGATVRREIGCPRIRPDHVAGACLESYSDRPVPHAQCETNAVPVVTLLNTFRASLGLPNSL
jgi:hypothetical protein